MSESGKDILKKIKYDFGGGIKSNTGIIHISQKTQMVQTVWSKKQKQ